MSQWTITTVLGGVTHLILCDSDNPPVISGPPQVPLGDPQAPVKTVVAATNSFVQARQNWLNQLNAGFVKLPPFVPNGPVPTGYQWWVRTGFASNVPSPYQATDMGLGVVLIWAAQGVQPPANDYS